MHLRDRRGTVRWRSLSQSFQHARARRRQAHTSLAPSWGAANKRTHISRRKTADSAATSLHTLLCRARQSRRGMHTRRGRPQPAGSQAHLCQARPTASHEHAARTVRQLRSRGPHPIKAGGQKETVDERSGFRKTDRQTDRLSASFPPPFGMDFFRPPPWPLTSSHIYARTPRRRVTHGPPRRRRPASRRDRGGACALPRAHDPALTPCAGRSRSRPDVLSQHGHVGSVAAPEA